MGTRGVQAANRDAVPHAENQVPAAAPRREDAQGVQDDLQGDRAHHILLSGAPVLGSAAKTSCVVSSVCCVARCVLSPSWTPRVRTVAGRSFACVFLVELY